MFMIQKTSDVVNLIKCATFTAKEMQCLQQRKITNALRPSRCLI